MTRTNARVNEHFDPLNRNISPDNKTEPRRIETPPWKIGNLSDLTIKFSGREEKARVHNLEGATVVAASIHSLLIPPG